MAGAIWGSSRAKPPAQILSVILPALSDHGIVAARRMAGPGNGSDGHRGVARGADPLTG